MAAPSIYIKDLLAAESSFGLVFADNLFIGREPTKPNDVVTIFDTVGLSISDELEGDGYERLTLQIRVRSHNYEAGWLTASQIASFLHGRANIENGDDYYLGIYCTSGPALLDWDGSSRVRFIINFLINRRLKQ